MHRTTSRTPEPSPLRLTLDSGATFDGRSFGANRAARGEVVFNTGMTGYVETLTDPSYRGQILVLTYPLQGNYGVPSGPFESPRIQVEGLVVSRTTDTPSHGDSTQSLGAWLREQGVPAMEGVDTRTLTRLLRERGTMDGALDSVEALDSARAERGVDMKNVAALVAPRETLLYPRGDLRILLIDTGAKESIIRALNRRGASVIRAPFPSAWEGFLDEVDGVVLGNGPGDPADLMPLVERLGAVLARGLPVFGVCLGHQLLALASGAKTYKLKYGHRSQNQPVMNRVTQRAYITSQNHGYAVDERTLPASWEPWFVNLNDGTNEGLRHAHRPFWSVQFHPEAAAGPQDTAFLFDDFLRMVGELRKESRREGTRTRLLAVAT